ncbi:hypothetical protein [Collimonas sp. OK412]|jgi:hypothetical protein|uniref:hypothetical protein n=1 Tax=Collimonas sp. (strain OK412) TaxID=1801619 RepID=UPI0008EC3EC3|nr:hypothetical protein [Collimonas sp. OK412]SFD03040.1 hypothetical protein SAMN04515619_1203 [Collimonas sp. OK412]
MKNTTRVRVAAVVGAAALRKDVTAVYDYSMSGFKNISASIAVGAVTGYDYSTSSHFSGGGNGSLDFYDYHNSKFVQLKLKEKTFEGYDYDSQKFFAGSVSGGSISLYDYETNQYYNYSV